MNASHAEALRSLVHGQRIAALGTLHEGEPFVSMVPFAVLPGGAAFVIHVSHLASHTRDMLQHAGVSLMVAAPLEPDIAPQALARVTIQAAAARCDEGTPAHASARAAYIDHFPGAAELFSFADFEVFLLTPQACRFIGGFARATDVSTADLMQVLRAHKAG